VKIGVFDSGVGGLSMAQAIQAAMQEAEVLLRDDRQHIPYWKHTSDELLGFVTPILQDLVNEGCLVIVVACNTVSTTIIDELRQRIEVPLIATEPMVKPAAASTKSGVIAVCATPATLASQRYAELKQTYASDLTVLEPDCSDWSIMIEANQIDYQKIETEISELLKAEVDTIVLGCTHYHWIETEIKELAAGHALVIQPEPAIIKQLQRVIDNLPTER